MVTLSESLSVQASGLNGAEFGKTEGQGGMTRRFDDVGTRASQQICKPSSVRFAHQPARSCTNRYLPEMLRTR